MAATKSFYLPKSKMKFRLKFFPLFFPLLFSALSFTSIYFFSFTICLKFFSFFSLLFSVPSLFPFALTFPGPHVLNSAMMSGNCCKLPKRIRAELGRQTTDWCLTARVHVNLEEVYTWRLVTRRQKPGNSNIVLVLRNKVKDRVKIKVRKCDRQG